MFADDAETERIEFPEYSGVWFRLRPLPMRAQTLLADTTAEGASKWMALAIAEWSSDRPIAPESIRELKIGLAMRLQSTIIDRNLLTEGQAKNTVAVSPMP